VSVLVTGGAGYIGSHTVKALRAAGQDVVIYDNLLAGHRAAAKGAGAPLEEGDVRDAARLGEVMKAHRVDAVMHFAALLSVGDSVKDPAGYYDNNVNGTLGVMRAAVAAGVKHFIFSSTAATFGNPVETPITESHPQRPINSYGQTKLAVEHALPHFERAYGLRSVVLRYFNAAGADPDGVLGEDHDPEIHVIPRAIDAALGRDSFAIYGADYETPDGTCLRDYVHVSDLASAHLLSLDSLRAGGPSAAYNLGNGRPISVREVVEAVQRVTGRTAPVTTGPRRPGDPGILFASSDKIKRELGWTPRYEDIDVIVETAWRWREAHPNGYGDRGSGIGDRVEPASPKPRSGEGA
jgi:UDP-glucose-4-epimerase GalE